MDRLALDLQARVDGIRWDDPDDGLTGVRRVPMPVFEEAVERIRVKPGVDSMVIGALDVLRLSNMGMTSLLVPNDWLTKLAEEVRAVPESPATQPAIVPSAGPEGTEVSNG